MRHHHVAVGTGLFVEGGTLAQAQRLGHVDLHMVDEIAVPDGLEQAVAEAEGQDVLRRLLAQEMVDAEDLLLREHFVQRLVQRHGAGKVGAEGFFHHDARTGHQARCGELLDGRQGGGRWHAQVVQTAAFDRQGFFRALDGFTQHRRAGIQRHVVEPRGELAPFLRRELARAVLGDGCTGDRAERFRIQLVERHADDAAGRDESRRHQVEQPGQQLAPRQVARRTEKHHHLRGARPYAG